MFASHTQRTETIEASESVDLTGKTVLITGSARRLGRELALSVARSGGDVIIHHGHSPDLAKETQAKIRQLGRQAHILQFDLSHIERVAELVHIATQVTPIFALVNSAAIFGKYDWNSTDYLTWKRHLDINLTAPFLLSQAFGKYKIPGARGRIVNILDWRALRPGADHLPYTISKAALAALTQSLAVALAPNITVNGLALGAVLPPSDGGDIQGVINKVPIGRWADVEEVGTSLLFLLTGPDYITGEIIHVDGGRHLV
jgi:NAD(P)-dependent dehydrogenase (short-subunit alcohol dehydrogenase family)